MAGCPIRLMSAINYNVKILGLKKMISTILIGLAAVVATGGIYYAWVSFPIISGFGAKQKCSCMFVSGRDEASVDKDELGGFPFPIVSYKVDTEAKTVTGSILGFAVKKAIYRDKLGCTLINEIPEEETRAQQFNIPQPPSIDQSNLFFPEGNKMKDSVFSGVDYSRLSEAINTAFTEPNPDKQQRTRAVVVLYNGELIAEKYAPGFNEYTKMYGWSMAKSTTAAQIGILEKEGKLNINEPAPVAFWKDPADPRHTITIKDLLQQMSGLDFEENYTKSSDVTDMLHKKADMGGYTASLPLAHQPGTVFNYSSGNSNILSKIIRNTLGEKNYAAFPYTSLFYRIGMYNSLLEPDANGTYVGSSYIMATAKDYARFGLLYLNNGIWQGERILPENWVNETTKAPAANKLQNYGYQFWLNGFSETNPKERVFKDVPSDLFYCDGFGEQGIFIIPSKKLVVVRLGLTLDKSFDVNGFLKDIIESVEKN